MRMRVVATALLALMALLLAAAALLRRHWPELAWLQAFAEAGLVGGLADWFAVVALFRHPLGLPFPHTAIVPRNKDRIGTELGTFVEHNFLTPENILARLDRLKLVAHALRWLERPANAAAVAATLRGFLPRLLAALDDGTLEAALGRVVARRIEALDAADLAAGAIETLTAEGRHQALLDEILKGLGDWLDRNRAALKARFGKGSRLMPGFVDSYVVNRFVGAVVDLVEEVVAADRHELRDSFDRYVAGVVERLRSDPDWREQAARLKRDLVGRVAPERLVAMLWGELRTRLTLDPDGRIEAHLAASIAALARDARRDAALVGRLETAARGIVELALVRFRHQFSTLIAEVVQRWDTREVTRNIELQVGRDLQFIRLNGTLVGGAAGLLLHAILVLAGAG